MWLYGFVWEVMSQMKTAWSWTLLSWSGDYGGSGSFQLLSICGVPGLDGWRHWVPLILHWTELLLCGTQVAFCCVRSFNLLTWWWTFKVCLEVCGCGQLDQSLSKFQFLLTDQVREAWETWNPRDGKVLLTLRDVVLESLSSSSRPEYESTVTR